MPQLFELLETRYTSRAACAAALGISRQAYHQARARRRLSERAAIRAAALLNIDPGAALLDNCEFQAKLDTDSMATWTVIPTEAGQRFQGKLDSWKR